MHGIYKLITGYTDTELQNLKKLDNSSEAVNPTVKQQEEPQTNECEPMSPAAIEGMYCTDNE